MHKNQIYTRDEVEKLLQGVLQKTLGAVDTAGVFTRLAGNRKVTGIAGSVIEQSVFGYPADTKRHPDLLIDGQAVELKTTGVREIKTRERPTLKSKACATREYRAKEPMSITAVTLSKIAAEEFETSSFWHKAQQLLLVFYHYAAEGTVPASGYADFPLVGYSFCDYTSEEIGQMRGDWQLVRNFVRELESTYSGEEIKGHYPRVSQLTRDMVILDTAPKYPNPPRFRFKRSFVDVLVQKSLGQQFEQLPSDYSSYEEIDQHLRQLNNEHSGKTVAELYAEFGLQLSLRKNTAEPIIVRMFGGTREKMGDVELFAKLGIQTKSIVLTPAGARTEDMKLFPIDFEEITDADLSFEDSQFYDYFANRQFLMAVFEQTRTEPRQAQQRQSLASNVFKGFKRLTFNQEFIEQEVRRTWNQVRQLVQTGQLTDVVAQDAQGNPKRNNKGNIVSAPNFPKSATNQVFVRGTGRDSSDKQQVVNGINMYRQSVWVKGSKVAELLQQTPAPAEEQFDLLG